MRKTEYLLPFFIIAVGVSLLHSCRKGNSTYTIPEFPPTTVFDSITDMTPAYAKGFKVTYLSDGTPLVDIVNPQGDGTAADTFRLALVRPSHHPDIPEGYHRLSVPISSAVCTSASQVSFFVGLDSLDIIKGITGTREQHSETVRKRIEDGNMEIIGTETSPDISLIQRLSPDVVLATPEFFNNKSVGDSRLTLIPIYSAYESHPLAQAEWIKLIAILIGKEDGGSDFFGKTEQNYNDAKVSTLEVRSRPPIRLAVNENGSWKELGKKYFTETFATDAGALGQQTPKGSVPLRIGYRQSISDFEETATVSPDAVLKDLVSIIHPEVIPKDSVWVRRFFDDVIR